MQLFETIDVLAAFLDAPGEAAPVDGIWLIQEYVRPERPVITRCEFIGGRFFYAVEVDASQGFELCRPTCARSTTPSGRPASSLGRSTSSASIEGFEHPVLERYVRFLAATGIEVAGIEFIRRADGSIVIYDVNTNTNYNARAEAAAGRYGMQELAAPVPADDLDLCLLGDVLGQIIRRG